MSGGEELHFFFGTRAMRVQWLANELGIKLKLKWVDLAAGDQRKEDYKKVNVNATLPFLVDGDVTLGESAAILQYLGDKYRTHKDLLISFDAKPAEKAAYYHALVYPISSMDDVIVPSILHTSVLPEGMRNPQIPADGKKKFDETFSKICTSWIKGKTWVAGDKFTLADIVLGYILGTAARLNWLGAYPDLQAYVGRITERAAFKKTWDRSNSDYPPAK